MSLGTIRAVARAERRRDEHRYAATRRQRALFLVAGAVFLPLLVVVPLSAYSLGTGVAAGETALRDLLRWYLPAGLGLVVYLGANNAGKRLLNFEARDLLLTTVPRRDLVYGLLLADGVTWTIGILGPTLLVATAFGVGTGSPLTVASAAAAVSLLYLACLLGGTALGLAARLALRRAPLSGSTRSLLATVGTVVAAVAAGGVGALFGSRAADARNLGLDALVPSGPPPVPLGYYADWLFLGTPAFDGVSAAAAGSLLAVLATVPLSVAAIHRLLPRLWYADPVRPDADSGTADRTASRGSRSWSRYRGRTALVVAGLFRRTLRSPMERAHVAYYVIAVGVLAAAGVSNPESLWIVVGFSVVLLGLWLAGGAFGLNPLGEEGAMLGQLLLSSTNADTVVRARVAAGLLVGIPPVLVGTALMGVGGLAPLDGAVLAGFWSLLAVVSAAAALGIGTLYPRSERERVLDVVETVPPEGIAIAVHAILTFVLAVAGGAVLVTAPPPEIRVLGGGVVAAGVIVLGHGGYRYAVAGLRDYGRQRRPGPVFAVELGIGVALLGLVASSAVSLAALAYLPVSGLPAFVLAFVGGYAGYAAVVVGYVRTVGEPWHVFGLRVPTGDDLRALAVGLAGSVAVYAALVVGVVAFDLPVSRHSLSGEIAGGGPAFALVLVALALLVNGPVEELLFRGVIQRLLAAALDERLAVVAAAVIFALAHLPVYATAGVGAVAVSMTTLTLLGSVWGWVYARTASVVPPALCHGLYNAALFGVAYVSLL